MGDQGLVGSRGTVLVVDYPLFAHDLAAYLERAGYRVEWLVPKLLNIELFVAIARALSPRFLVSINFSPELALLATLGRTPYASWTVDPLGKQRFELYPNTDPALLLAFAHRKSTVERLRAIGLAGASFLPLGAAERRRPVTDRAVLERHAAPLSFVANSLADEYEKLRRLLRAHGADAELVARFATCLDEMLGAHEGSVEYAGVGAACDGVPEALLGGLAGIDLATLGDAIDGALSHRLRALRVASLAPLGIVTYGDAGWSAVGAPYRGIADHGEELTAIYTASALNLDVPRIYQRDIVTMRVFDIMGTGGLVLSEPSPDLLELFSDGHELVTYRSEKELVATAERLLGAPEERAHIAAAGERAVRERHGLDQRFGRILEVLGQRGFA